jgi:hypothetical protein
MARMSSLKSWFLSGLGRWKELSMGKALEFGLRVMVFELLYAIVTSCTLGGQPG